MQPDPEVAWLLRMTRVERLQHYALLVTFVLLSVSGGVLLIPNSNAARALVAMLGGMPARAIVHRVAAAGLIGLGLFHIVWILKTPRGREVMQHMRPRWSDIGHLLHRMLFIFGLVRTDADCGRFTFIEKFEYWAVAWGMFSMGVTGAVMTFTDWSLRYLPKWVWEACKIVHGWEALLAITTIAIWHLYHALWRPGGPNWSWVTGYLTADQLMHEHPGEFKQLINKAEVVEQPPANPTPGQQAT
jgi:cytochrome b subunit of formate dehydrogenase